LISASFGADHQEGKGLYLNWEEREGEREESLRRFGPTIVEKKEGRRRRRRK
jgi:hypothetical protein